MEKVKVYQPCYIHPTAKIGENTQIGKFCDIGKNVVIGKNCNIQCHVSISNKCIVGDNVFIGPGARLLNDKFMDGNIEPVVVKDHVKIGGGAIIGPGVTLYERAIIGMGAVVTKDVPGFITVVGNPAKRK